MKIDRRRRRTLSLKSRENILLQQRQLSDLKQLSDAKRRRRILSDAKRRQRIARLVEDNNKEIPGDETDYAIGRWMSNSFNFDAVMTDGARLARVMMLIRDAPSMTYTNTVDRLNEILRN